MRAGTRSVIVGRMNRWLVGAVALGLLGTSCTLRIDPQTVIVLGAGPRTAARVTWLRVTVTDNEGAIVERSTRSVPDEVGFPATIPITARDGDAQRRFELLVEAFDTAAEPTESAAPFNVLRVLAGYERAAVVELPVELTDGCMDFDGCGPGRTCWQGECRGACFERPPRVGVLATPRCAECQSCARGRCTDLAAGTACGCPGDTCQGSRCELRASISEARGSLTHTCAITGDRELYCWGANQDGQLGLGTNTPATTPAAVRAGIRSVVAGGAERSFACGIASGTSEPSCWGANQDGQLGIGGASRSRTTPTSLDTRVAFDALAAGGAHACGLEPGAGELYCWGSGSHGKLGDGAILERGSPVRVLGPQRWTQVCAGTQHTCALDAEGQIYCWGFNQDFQLGSEGALDRTLPALVSLDASTRWRRVACGSFSTCGLSEDGVVMCWGGNQRGNLGRCSVDRGDNAGSPAPIESDLRFSALQCGGSHCCAIEADDARLFCWGANAFGQAGDGTTLDRVCTPREVAPGLRFVALGLGAAHSCAMDERGGLWCWGNNTDGQLGLGHTDPRLVPARVCFPDW